MQFPASRVRILIMLLVGLLYVGILIRNLHETEHSSLRLRETSAGDNVSVSIKIVEADIDRSEVRAFIRLRPVGNFAKDSVTPARDLKLFLNSVRGTQEIDFPAGERVNPIEAQFSLDGDANLYPFDRYQTTLWLLLTTPSRRRPPTQATPSSPKNSPARKSSNKHRLHYQTEAADTEGTETETNMSAPVGTALPVSDFMVEHAALEQNDTVPISIDLEASIPGDKFGGKIARTEGRDLTGVDLNMRRADGVIVVSICVMLIMMSLAVSLLAMVLKATGVGSHSTLLPLSLSVSLIFGLPALRNNVQPGVPPVGVFGDYISFIWAELIVAISTVIVVWTWIVKSKDDSD